MCRQTQAAEQRVKQLQEELKCQRQNAETSRCNAEQRRKEMEREHQRVSKAVCGAPVILIDCLIFSATASH